MPTIVVVMNDDALAHKLLCLQRDTLYLPRHPVGGAHLSVDQTAKENRVMKALGNKSPEYSSTLRVSGCEFCDELTDPRSSRFGRIYGPTETSRIVATYDAFVVMPTIGQLFRSSLLILPVDHFETMAEVPYPLLGSLVTLLAQIEAVIQSLGIPILFEHGARCSTGGGCGIYHAHMHLMPVPRQVHCADVLPDSVKKAHGLLEALSQLRNSASYLLFRDTVGQVVFLEVTEALSQKFASQYFRRMLARHFHLEKPWDWRAYTREESWLLDTLEWFGVNRVPVS